jgi:hypothetical protein
MQMFGATQAQRTWCCRSEALGSTSATAAPARGTEKLSELTPDSHCAVTSHVYVGLCMCHGHTPVRGSSASCTAARAPAAFFTASLGPCTTMRHCWHSMHPRSLAQAVLLFSRRESVIAALTTRNERSNRYHTAVIPMLTTREMQQALRSEIAFCQACMQWPQRQVSLQRGASQNNHLTCMSRDDAARHAACWAAARSSLEGCHFHRRHGKRHRCDRASAVNQSR